MAFTLSPVKAVDTITRDEFEQEHIQPRRPVLIRGDVSRDWPAYNKWTLGYLRDVAGDVEVGLDGNLRTGPESVASPAHRMRFGDYLDIIEAQPSELHIFGLLIAKAAPALCDDFVFPEHLLTGFLKDFPALFVGGQGSIVHLHYDWDFPHLLQTHFGGRKRVLLFGPSESTKLYRLPWTVQSPVDAGNPDLARYPLAAQAQGLETVMEHGDTILIPAGWWHYMEYLAAGFSLTMRAWPRSAQLRLRTLANVLATHVVDNPLQNLCKAQWFYYREGRAIRRAVRRMRATAAS